MGVLAFVLFILMMLGTFIIDIFIDVSIRRDGYKPLFIGCSICTDCFYCIKEI